MMCLKESKYIAMSIRSIYIILYTDGKAEQFMI